MASGGAGGKEVGRLSIRVVPDMDGFREKVEAAARGAGRDVVVDVDADTTKARREIREVTSEKHDTRVDLDLDEKGYREKLRAVTRPVDQKVKIKVESDTYGLDLAKKRIDRFLTENDLENGRAGIRLQNAMRDWSPRAVAGRDLAAMEQRINLKPHLDESGIEEMRLRLAHEHMTMKVKVEVDRNNLERMALKTSRDMEDLFAGVGRGGGMFARLMENAATGGGGGASRFASKMPDFLPNIGGLGGVPSVALIVGGLSLLTPALALLSQALVGLPALVSAVALPIGVFALGLGGIKKALDESGLIDIITGKKGKEKTAMGAGLKEVQKQISDVFEQGFTPLFRQVAGVLPALTRGLPFVAKGITDLAGGLTKAIVNPQNVAMFDRFTNSVSSMLTRMGPGLESFSTGMFKLITNVGDHLPGLGTKLSGYADKFDKWVDRISKPKDDGSPSTLDTAVTNLGPVFDRITGFVGHLLDRGLDLANDPNLMKGIDDFLKGLTNLAMQLSTMGPVFDKLAGILAKVQGILGTDIPRKPDGSIDPKRLPPGVQMAPNPSAQQPGLPAGVMHAPSDSDRANAKKWHEDFDPKKGGSVWDNFERWFGRTFTRPHTDHPNIVKMGGEGATDQNPVPVKPIAPPTPGSPGPLGPMFPGVTAPMAPKAAVPALPPGVGVGTAGAAPTIKAPKVEAPKLPPGSEKIWDPLIASTQAATGQVNGAVQAMVGQITGSLQSLQGAGLAAGTSIGTGMAAGIAASAPSAIAAAQALAQGVAAATSHALEHHSPSKVFQRIGESTGQGFEIGMDDSFQSVLDKSRALAAQVSSAMESSGGLSPDLQGSVKKDLAAIGVQYDRLKLQSEGLDKKDPARKGLQAQMAELQSLRTELGLAQKESGFDQKYGGLGGQSDSMQQAASMITTALAQGIDAIKGFASANLGQLQSDLGMSGNGAVEALGNYGVGFLTQSLGKVAQGAFGGDTTINVQTPEQAFAMRDNEKQRQSLQHAGR